MISLDTVGNFTWSFGNKFHIETPDGNYEWSDPGYLGGDNTIKPSVPYDEWLVKMDLPFGRDKGTHIIRYYCGKDVKFVGCNQESNS